MTEASGSEACASTPTDVVSAGTVIVAFSATVESFTLMLFKLVSAEGRATTKVTLYSVTVVPFAAVTLTVRVLLPATSELAPVTWNCAPESAVATFTATAVVPLPRFTVEPGAA